MNVPSTFVHDCSLDLPTDKFFFNLITGWRQGFNRIHGSRASSMNNWMILVVDNTFFTHIANCNELGTQENVEDFVLFTAKSAAYSNKSHSFCKSRISYNQRLSVVRADRRECN